MPINQEQDIIAGKFSAKLIGSLKSIVKNHNKSVPENKTTFNQIKEVYLNAANNYCYAGYSRGEWALARVNMFLRILSGDKPESMTGYEEKNMAGLTFATKVIQPIEELDISINWVPSQQDFTKAKKEINQNELYFNFASTDELYLEDYKPIELKIY